MPVPEQTCQLSIIIVSWNTCDLLRACLASIARHIDPAIGFETLVIDNASSDGSAAMVRERFPGVRLIENAENLGFARGVNQGAARARGRYLLLLNSDTCFLDDTFTELLQAMNGDDSIGVLGGAVIMGDQRAVFRCFAFPSLLSLVKSYSFDLIYKLRSRSHQRARTSRCLADGRRICEADWLSGAYLLVRRELMEGETLLDSRIFMYFEDTLLCKRAWDRGYRVVFLETGDILHLGGASARKAALQTTLHSYQSSRIYVREMYGPRALLWYERIMRVLWCSCLPLFYLAGAFGFRVRAAEKRRIIRKLRSLPPMAIEMRSRV